MHTILQLETREKTTTLPYLRYVVKKEDFFNFETDILDKFNYLLEIENYSEKL